MRSTNSFSASSLHSLPCVRQIRLKSPCSIDSLKVILCNDHSVSFPERMSLIRMLKGLSSPLCVEITRILPPQITRAFAACMTLSRSSKKAASSMTTLPCFERSDRETPGNPIISAPEENEIMSLCSCRDLQEEVLPFLRFRLLQSRDS